MSPQDTSPLLNRPLALNHRYIEAFRAVMIRGTATEAAAMLHTTQPVISKLIARFQQVSGVNLFELRKSRLVPTPEARILFDTIERSYIGLEQIGHAIEELRGAHSGRVQVGCLPSLGMGLLPEVIRDFRKDYPGILVSLETVDSNQVRTSVASGRLDLGITMRQIDTAGTHAEPLIEVGAVCVLPKTHHLAKKKTIHAKDLDGQAFVAAGPHDSMRAMVEWTLAQEGSKPVTVVESTYAITTCLLVLQGVGVGVVSPLIVQPLVKAGLVVRPFFPRIPIELVLLTPLGQPPSRIAQAFMAQLKWNCGELAKF